MQLAEPEGYLRVFTSEGPTLAALLKALGRPGPAAAYARRLLAAGRARTQPRRRPGSDRPFE